MIAHGTVMDRHFLVSGLHGRMMTMAKHKFASNVVEKALVHSDPDVRRGLIDELLTPQSGNENPVQVMMKDQYASMLSMLNSIWRSFSNDICRLRPANGTVCC